jgi:hypothetical protein
VSVGLFRRMLVEEWRLHARLFGSGRFLAFPLFVAAITGGGVYLLALTGTPIADVVAGLQALALFFGLQVGTIGLVGRDALRNALGDVTLVVFSARTLPVTWRRLLAVFLVKDVVYYTGLFLLPVAVGFAPTALAEGLTPANVGLLWVTAAATFALGMGLSLTAAGVATRSRLALVGAVAVVTAGVLALGLDPVRYTPYAIYGEGATPATLARGLAPAVVLLVAGPLLFRPASGRRARTHSERFSAVRRWVPGGDALVARTLLDVARSSGSVWKVPFSLGLLFGVTAFLLDRIAAATALSPSPGIAFGTLVGLGAFTTYNWVTQFDAAGEYGRYPVSLARVFAAKRTAYLMLVVPFGLGLLALGALWYPVADLAVGVVVLPLVAVYVFGVTAYVAGLSPNELLFDTPRFAAFGAALSLVSLPLLVAALAAPVAPVTTAGVAVGVSVVAALVGVGLSARAGPRWASRERR